MAREIRTLTWCDICAADDMDVEGIEYTLAAIEGVVIAPKPGVVAACEPHFKEFIEPVLVILERIAIPVDKLGATPAAKTSPVRQPTSGRPVEPTDCQICGGTYKNVPTQRSHIRQQHGINLDAYNKVVAGEITLEQAQAPEARADAVAAVPPEYRCPVKDCDVAYSPNDYKSPGTALSSHMRNAHGLTGAEAKALRDEAAAQREEMLV